MNNTGKLGRPPLLSPNQQAEIVARLLSKELGKDLAKEFGVSPMVISNLRNKRRPRVAPTAARLDFLTASFWSRICINGENDCWPFQGADLFRYGRFNADISGSTLAHVTAYTLAHPSKARPQIVRHLCDNRACCNPSHLCAGTKAENAADRRHRAALEATGHTGPTPVTVPMPPPTGGWPIRTDVEMTRVTWEIEQLRDKVVIDRNECWIWSRPAAHKFGYGNVKGMNAHRYSYLLHFGYLPPRGEWVLHACGVAACCNPEHLYAGTPEQNAVDTNRHGRRPTGELHPNAKLSDKQVRVMRERYWTQGATLEGVASEFGVSLGSASRILKGEGYPHAQGPTGTRLRGTRYRCLDAQQVAAARRRVRGGESIPVLARALGIHVETLRDAVKGKSWKQVVEPPLIGANQAAP